MRVLILTLLLPACLSQTPVVTEQWSLAVLVDVSASMRLGDLNTGLPVVAERLKAGAGSAGSVRIGTFASEIFLSPPLNKSLQSQFDINALNKGAGGRQGPSRVWDALAKVATDMAGDPGRKVILVVTDGKATGNQGGPAVTAALLRELKIELWLGSVVRGFGDDRLRSFAASQGGRVLEAWASDSSRWRNVERVVADATRDLAGTGRR